MNSGGRIDSVAVCNHELVTVPEDDSVLSGLIADLQVGAGHQDQLLHLRLIHSHLVRDTVRHVQCAGESKKVESISRDKIILASMNNWVKTGGNV